MIPILYEKNETEFASNGLGRLRDIITCKCTEERNGVYEVDFDYPVSGSHYEDIQAGRYIAVEHDDTGDVQPFEIVSYTEPINGVVSFHCQHISYKQSRLTASGTNINSLADALSMLRNATPNNPFTYWTDKTSTGYMASADGVPRSVRSFLGGVEGSILDAYGGEYEWDKWLVKLHTARGDYKDITVRYGVNLTEYSNEVDYSGSYTAVIPYWTGDDGNGGTVVVKGNMVESGASSFDGRVNCVPLDLTEKFQSRPTTAQLESMASSVMASEQPYLPAQTIQVSFVRLQDTNEYSQYASLMTCRLCDTINVEFPRYKMSGKFKIVKTVYDVLLERYEEMELGTLSTTLSEALGISGDSNIANPSAKYPVKVARFGWQISGSAAARSKLASGLSPSNSANPGDIPSGYTFLCWVEFTTSGWVGTPYAPNPMAETTEIWCYSDKPATTGVSLYGTALYLRSDLT